jgi:hypothetical protein
MKKLPFAGLFLPVLLSCHIRVTTTRIRPPLVTPEQIDTVIVLRPSDERPPPARTYLTSTIKISNFSRAGTYDTLLNYAQRTARQQGGNVAEVTEAARWTLSRASMRKPSGI